MQKVDPPTDRTVRDMNVIIFVSDRLSTNPPLKYPWIFYILDFSVDWLEVHGIAIFEDT